MSGLETGPIRRVLLALDAAGPGPATLDAAAGLAFRLDAELAAVLVEEADLLRATALPSSRHLALPGGERLDLDAVGAGVRASADRARSLLEAAAARRQVRWSFQAMRERAVRELLETGGAEELLVVERPRDRLAGMGGLTGLLGAATAGTRPVLVLGPAMRPGGARPGGRVSVVWDESESAAAALDLALRICRGVAEGPSLLVAAAHLAEAERLAGAAAPRAGRWLSWRWAGGSTPGDLLRSLPLDAVLVVGAGSPAAGGASGRARLLREARGPVLLVRRPDAPAPLPG